MAATTKFHPDSEIEGYQVGYLTAKHIKPNDDELALIQVEFPQVELKTPKFENWSTFFRAIGNNSRPTTWRQLCDRMRAAGLANYASMIETQLLDMPATTYASAPSQSVATHTAASRFDQVRTRYPWKLAGFSDSTLDEMIRTDLRKVSNDRNLLKKYTTGTISTEDWTLEDIFANMSDEWMPLLIALSKYAAIAAGKFNDSLFAQHDTKLFPSLEDEFKKAIHCVLHCAPLEDILVFRPKLSSAERKDQFAKLCNLVYPDSGMIVEILKLAKDGPALPFLPKTALSEELYKASRVNCTVREKITNQTKHNDTARYIDLGRVLTEFTTPTVVSSPMHIDFSGNSNILAYWKELLGEDMVGGAFFSELEKNGIADVDKLKSILKNPWGIKPPEDLVKAINDMPDDKRLRLIAKFQ